MSNISNTIDALISDQKPAITGADLARATGINMAQISRIRNGLQIWVNPDDIYKMSLAFSGGDAKSVCFQKVHAKLLYARLQDECVGPGAELIKLQLFGNRVPKATDTKPKPVLPPSLQEQMDLIGEHIAHNVSVREFVEAIANLCRRVRDGKERPEANVASGIRGGDSQWGSHRESVDPLNIPPTDTAGAQFHPHGRVAGPPPQTTRRRHPK